MIGRSRVSDKAKSLRFQRSARKKQTCRPIDLIRYLSRIRDRLKDVIISGGENISSIEVESILLRHPAVQEVAIVGLPHERWGEAPHAFVVPRQGAQTDEAELREFARANLAHFKAPQ